MNDGSGSQPSGSQKREDAAIWFARMRGPDADTDRAEFEAWLAASPLHRDAYNRIAEVFSLGKGLKPQPTRGVDVLSPEPTASRGSAWAMAIVSLTIVLGGGAWSVSQQRSALSQQSAGITSPDHAPGTMTYTTRLGQIRRYRLRDGSSIILDTNSRVELAFNKDVRALRLAHGRARFEVAHERRPFVVAAGAGTVTAHGTLFDVRLQANNAVSVRLLRGAVDVTVPHQVSTTRRGVLRERLVPGQQLVFDASALSRPRSATTPGDARWPEATFDCDHQSLSTVVAEANRYATTQIVLADGIADLRVSGSFRINDPTTLAQRLAALFDLRVDKPSSDRLILRQN